MKTIDERERQKKPHKDRKEQGGQKLDDFVVRLS